LSSHALQHIRVRRRFSSPLRSVRLACPAYRKVPSSGFGYPLDGFRLQALGNLFQSPTLMGFALQSLVPPRRSMGSFEPHLPLRRFPAKPPGFAPALQRLDLPEEAVSSAPRMFSPGRSLMLSWAFGPLGFSPPPADSRSVSLLECPSRPLTPSPLTRRGDRDPRDLRPRGVGISRYRAPTRLAF
jgi:hypothetical protein